jgi:hypothetical protein
VQKKILTKILAKVKFLRQKIMCLRVSYKKKYEKKKLFASLKSLKKRVGSKVRSGAGSMSKRYGSRGSGSGTAPKCYRSPTLLNRLHTIAKTTIQF